MKSKVKPNLLDVAKYVLDLIDKGEDFIVTEYRSGGFIPFPIGREDTEPHVCDFMKAGLEKELVAYYFAYLLCSPCYDIFATKSGRSIAIQEDIRPTWKEKKVVGDIIDEYWDKADQFKKERKENKQTEEETL